MSSFLIGLNLGFALLNIPAAIQGYKLNIFACAMCTAAVITLTWTY